MPQHLTQLCHFNSQFILLLVFSIFASTPSSAQDSKGTTATAVSSHSNALDDYVALPEPAYQWSITANENIAGNTRIVAKLTSQTWHGGDWTHDVRIIRPVNCRHTDAAILFVNGGNNKSTRGDDMDEMLLALAQRSGMAVVALFQVPNQPLLNGKSEDALIAATWLKYLETGDATWPLLFPMVKSAVKTMDAVGEISEQEFGGKTVNRFIVTGASKRGWTSWLSAVADDRVVGIAPMVIDTLNFQKQIADQKAEWGYYSEQIADYTENGLIHEVNEPDGVRRLREMMDPFEYLDRITVPKLLVHGANDRYWRCDAMDNYWSDLDEPKNVLTIPNAGHSLNGGETEAATAIAVFADRCASKERLPEITWKTNVDKAARNVTVTCNSDQAAARIEFWVTINDTRDFRDSVYSRTACTEREGNTGTLTVDVPEGQHAAIFATLVYGDGKESVQLSTGVCQPY